MRTVLALACSAPAVANDGIGSVSADGILFGKTDAVAMKKEVLSVSTELIRGEYEFLNESGTDVEEAIFFPQPAPRTCFKKSSSTRLW